MAEPSYAELKERLERAEGHAENQQRLIAELRESKEHYHALFKLTDEGFCIIEMIYDEHKEPIDWLFLETNPAFETQNGIPNAVGKRVSELSTSVNTHWFKLYGDVARTGKPTRFQTETKDSDGNWFDLYAFRIGESGSNKVAIIFRNITERKEIESKQLLLVQSLRDQQFYTRSLIESNSDAVMITDLSGNITDVNKQMETLTGSTRDELIGSPSKTYFTDTDQASAFISQVLATKKVTNYDLTVLDRNGKEISVSYNAVTLYDRDRKLLGVIAAAHPKYLC
jgi:PAS domain S-box-containing protein